MPRILNMATMGRKLPEGAVYVGRPTKWGNPFAIGRDGERATVVRKFERWLMTQPELVEQAKQELRGKNLACWCAPKACHAEVLARIANE